MSCGKKSLNVVFSALAYIQIVRASAKGCTWEEQLDWAANIGWTGLLYLYLLRKLKNFSCAADFGRHQQLHEQLGQQAGRSQASTGRSQWCSLQYPQPSYLCEMLLFDIVVFTACNCSNLLKFVFYRFFLFIHKMMVCYRGQVERVF